jgi:hypothetical protein
MLGWSPGEGVDKLLDVLDLLEPKITKLDV